MKVKQSKIRRVRDSIDKEPKWTQNYRPERLDIIKALNWYNTERDEKDAAKILKTTPAIARNFLTLAWSERMAERGFVQIGSYLDEMRKRFKALNQKNTRQLKTDTSNVVSIQERVKAKTDEIIGEMQGLIDEYGVRGNHTDMNAYQWMMDNNVKPIHAARIAEFFREQSKEIFEAATGKDKELKEGYSNFKKSRLLNLLHAHSSIVNDALKLSENKKTSRKPRKKKPVSFDKMVSKTKYKEKDDTLKIHSIDPVRIIGAMQLWVYNTKTRKLGVYHAADADGLKMKGTTIQNYLEAVSVSKTLRKPEVTLQNVTGAGKIALRKLLEGIKAKPTKMNGRINKDTLLLRVV